ncbi:vWA domain-containing protein [Parafilimonas terrae]|uniref:Ca-activated chloride channel family protein n=1 Tax=Parafilimonas terrae TaxID=1465490 RepID=A0A1I5YM36_9BACT|nr:VWA domain-containing protein [Parafilimonas terrae]SFQ45344.1 Ca-activated chloride channel family protein [Parafilimonas terrae]
MLTDWYQNIEFAHTWVLGALLLMPILVYEYIRRNKKQQASMLVTTTYFVRVTKNLRVSLRHLPFVLRCLALVCLILALARPRIKFTETQNEGEGIDIVLCFDISGSMTEKDFEPNRLEAAKQVASSFVSNRPGDEIGIVIFSNLSFTLCPLTSDHDAVLNQVKNIQSGYLQDEGTAIGSGIATSVDRLRYSKVKSKIIILLTDGVDFGGTIPPDMALQMAKYYGIKIYTIGVGSEKEVDEVVDSPLGPVVQHKTLQYNEALLKKLADETGGQYFHATDKSALQKIYGSINQLEKSKIKVKTYNRYTDKFLPLLVAAVIYILIEALLRYTVFRKFP